MSVRFSCTSCGKELTADPQQAGERLLCPRCGVSVAVPAVGASPPGAARSIAVAMRFACPKCSGLIEIDARETGTQVTCLRCHAAVRAPDSLLGPGAFLGGYQIVRPLDSADSSGDAFLAKAPSAEDKAVLKVLRLDISTPKDARDRLLRELRDAARLQHPNIVAVHEVCEEGGMVFAVTEYVDGDSVDALVKTGHPLPEQQALAIAKQVVYALTHAWEKLRLTHMDLKPAKLIVDRRGRLKVVGFGWPKEDPVAAGRAGPVVTNFMSPEVLEGRVLGGSRLNELSGRPSPDSRSDMYSLGLLLYYMVTAQVPFKGKTILDTLQKQVGKSLPDPREFQPQLTASCVALLEKMLAHKLARRHVNWAELLADVERAQQDTLASLPPLPSGESALTRHDKTPATGAAHARKRLTINATGSHRDGPAAAGAVRGIHAQTLAMSLAHRGPGSADTTIMKVMIAVVIFLIFLVAIAAMIVVHGRHERDKRVRTTPAHATAKAAALPDAKHPAPPGATPAPAPATPAIPVPQTAAPTPATTAPPAAAAAPALEPAAAPKPAAASRPKPDIDPTMDAPFGTDAKRFRAKEKLGQGSKAPTPAPAPAPATPAKPVPQPAAAAPAATDPPAAAAAPGPEPAAAPKPAAASRPKPDIDPAMDAPFGTDEKPLPGEKPAQGAKATTP